MARAPLGQNRVSPKQNRFSRGQISKKMHGSQDLELYYTALEICRNYIVDGRGMLERRPGTRFRARTKNDGPAVLLPFAYSQEQAYVLEMGDGYLRALFDGGVVLDGGVPFEIATPYTSEDVYSASFHQLNDLMWLACRSIPFKAIERVAIDEFTIDDFVLKDGPYLDANPTYTKLIPTTRNSFTPLMTSNGSPSGIASDSTGSGTAYRAFDGDPNSPAVINAQSGWIQYQTAGAPLVVDAYFLAAIGPENPSDWVIEGSNDGINYDILDSRAGETDWAAGERRTYSFKNGTAYNRYRLNWRVNGDINSPDTLIAELGFNISGDFAAASTMTATSTDGINSGQGFNSGDIGRSIRVLGSENIWRYVVIDSINSPTSVQVRMYGSPLIDLSPITTWRMGAVYGGNYASVVTIHENRLAIAVGNRVCLSAPDDYTNFAPTKPDGTVTPDNAIVVTIPSYNSKRGAVSDVEVLKSYDFQLFVGTAAGNFTIQSNSFGDGITPDNATCRPQDGRGAGRVECEIIGASVIYAHNTYKKLMGTYEKGSGRMGAQDLSLPADDIAERGIRWMAYQESPHGVLWVGLDDGSLAGFTVQPEEKVQAWHEHPLGGRFLTNGRILPAQVESGCVIPADGGKRDDVYFIVKRTVGSQTRRFIETLEPYWVVGQDTKQAFFVDGGLKYDGNDNETATISVSGSGPTTVRTITTTNCPPFIAGSVLSIFDGTRWHRGEILTVDGSNNLTWAPVRPNAEPGPPDGQRWFDIDGQWVQLAEGEEFDVYAPTYMDLDQTTNIFKWSVGLTTLTGLSDYEGALVDLLVDGFFIPGKLVTGGTVTGIPNGTIIVVGFHEPTKGKLLSIEAGSQNGSAQDKQRPVYETVIDVLDTGADIEMGTGLPSSYGGTWEHYSPCTYGDKIPEYLIEGDQTRLFTGTARNTRDENGNVENPSVAWRQPSPLPSFIRGIITRLNESDGK